VAISSTYPLIPHPSRRVYSSPEGVSLGSSQAVTPSACHLPPQGRLFKVAEDGTPHQYSGVLAVTQADAYITFTTFESTSGNKAWTRSTSKVLTPSVSTEAVAVATAQRATSTSDISFKRA